MTQEAVAVIHSLHENPKKDGAGIHPRTHPGRPVLSFTTHHRGRILRSKLARHVDPQSLPVAFPWRRIASAMPTLQAPPMVTSGTPSPIQISQKRLTFYCISFGLIGSITAMLLWWDSNISFSRIISGSHYLTLISSEVLLQSSSPGAINTNIHFDRDQVGSLGNSDNTLFPGTRSYRVLMAIPIYLLILSYLATLLLIWVILMNRLARRDFTKTVTGLLDPEGQPTRGLLDSGSLHGAADQKSAPAHEVTMR